MLVLRIVSSYQCWRVRITLRLVWSRNAVCHELKKDKRVKFKKEWGRKSKYISDTEVVLSPIPMVMSDVDGCIARAGKGTRSRLSPLSFSPAYTLDSATDSWPQVLSGPEGLSTRSLFLLLNYFNNKIKTNLPIGLRCFILKLFKSVIIFLN